MIKTYYLLTKPGIILGNMMTTTAGFALASKGHFDIWLFLFTFLGLSLIIASACVFNNYIDRHADAKMMRTQSRPLAKKLITAKSAILFAILLGLMGTLLLACFTNLSTVLIALGGFSIYVVLYSFWKYRTTLATLVGSIAGATPPVVGYCAVSNQLDIGALLLFASLFLWQMPHFYAIAMYRFNDYTAASIPVLPAKKGMQHTKLHMLLYILAFTLAALALPLCSYANTTYLAITALLSLSWLFLSLRGFKAPEDLSWARNMFRLSLVIITALCLLLTVESMSLQV